ncbi:MAG: DUF4430 domain-containing protein [Firmicutes bacterium]|nr:DUF4430 domain-containing protein [Bacillota bacterium]
MEVQPGQSLPEEDPEAPSLSGEEDKEDSSSEDGLTEEAAGEEDLEEGLNAEAEAEISSEAQELPPTDTPTETVEPPAEAVSPEKAPEAPAADAHPEPVEPDSVSISDVAHSCYMSISCATVLENMELLDPEKVELIPSDGILFARKEVTFYEGESVFNVLQRELKQAGIQMEHSSTPIFNSAYIEGLANLYEMDCGPLSGWMYQVNGWYPNYGSSRYQLQPGDEIQWRYSCDQGRDIGGEYAAGKQ